MHKLKEERGDFAINGAFILILVFAALALAITFFGVINRSLKLHTMAAELLRYTEVRGQVDEAVYRELDRLEREAGFEVNGTVTANYLSGSRQVQFGNVITVHLEHPTSFGLGGVVSVPVTLRTTVSGRSEYYWK